MAALKTSQPGELEFLEPRGRHGERDRAGEACCARNGQNHSQLRRCQWSHDSNCGLKPASCSAGGTTRGARHSIAELSGVNLTKSREDFVKDHDGCRSRSETGGPRGTRRHPSASLSPAAPTRAVGAVIGLPSGRQRSRLGEAGRFGRVGFAQAETASTDPLPEGELDEKHDFQAVGTLRDRQNVTARFGPRTGCVRA